jgi:hypothetical protein
MIMIKPNCPDNTCCYSFCCADMECTTGEWWGISVEEHIRRYDGMFASEEYSYITNGYCDLSIYTMMEWTKWILAEMKYHHKNGIDLDHTFKHQAPSYKRPEPT